jgi:hypothetical protein
MKRNKLIAVVMFAMAAVACTLPRPGGCQERTAAATGFPEKLLEGDPDFNFAFLLHADIRGNFGPCG